MTSISLDSYMSATLGVLVFYTGKAIYRKTPFFQKYSFPPAVIGGLFFAIIFSTLAYSNIFSIKLDTTLQSFFMDFFFTTVGATTSLSILKKTGKPAIVLLLLASVLLICQNFLSIFVGNLFSLSHLQSLCTGSVALVGGHGTSFAFGSEIAKLGFQNASEVALASATFGLVFGSLIGGPIGTSLIKKYNLSASTANNYNNIENDTNTENIPKLLTHSFMLIIFSMGFGSVISIKLKELGIILPRYVGSMLIAASVKHFLEIYRGEHFEIKYINKLSSISLSIFLSMALVSIQLTDLVNLAVPMLSILSFQVIFIALFVYFIAFKVLGKDYDAAIICAGLCGFGLGATPTAMANIGILNDRFGKSQKALLVVPMVGALFIDFINSIVLTMFINI